MSSCMGGGIPINMHSDKVEFVCLDCGRTYPAGDTTLCKSKGLLKKRIEKEIKEIETAHALDKELANVELDVCEHCKKKIRFWHMRVNGISGEYHNSCYNKKFRIQDGGEKQ